MQTTFFVKLMPGVSPFTVRLKRGVTLAFAAEVPIAVTREEHDWLLDQYGTRVETTTIGNGRAADIAENLVKPVIADYRALVIDAANGGNVSAERVWQCLTRLGRTTRDFQRDVETVLYRRDVAELLRAAGSEHDQVAELRAEVDNARKALEKASEAFTKAQVNRQKSSRTIDDTEAFDVAKAHYTAAKKRADQASENWRRAKAKSEEQHSALWLAMLRTADSALTDDAEKLVPENFALT